MGNRLGKAAWFDGDTLHAEVVRISDLGNRFVGSSGERRCRDYLLAEFAAAGLNDVHLEPVEYPGMDEADATCQVISDESWELECVPLQYTASATVSGPAVYLGEGTEEDIADAVKLGVDLAGRVVVVEAPLIVEVAGPLAERGAAAIVHISSTLGDAPGHFGARFYPAPKRAEWMTWALPIPGVTVSRATGRQLLRRLSLTPTHLRVQHRVQYQHSETANVVGVLPGGDSSRFVVVGAHYDTQREGPGASDNATGIATLLALARRLHPASRTRWSLVLVALAAEEVGAWGARAFAAEAERAAASIAMVNLDALGSPISATRTVVAHPALVELASKSAAEVGWDAEATVDARSIPLADHAPFIDAGVPACWLFRYPPNHPYYHTAHDVPRQVDARRLGVDAAASVNLALALADLPDEHPLLRRGPQPRERAVRAASANTPSRRSPGPGAQSHQ